MQKHPPTKLELRRNPSGAAYFLNDQRIKIGEQLEIWTTRGWETGAFSWDGEPHLPYLDRGRQSGAFAPGERYQTVILTKTLCRRPDLELRNGFSPVELQKDAR
jgi:hypothetical protein